MLLLLWCAVVLCAVAGFIMGFSLGKVHTMRKMDLIYTKEQVDELIKENEELIQENQKYICKYLDLESTIKSIEPIPPHIDVDRSDYKVTYDYEHGNFLVTIKYTAIDPYDYEITKLWLILREREDN